MTTDPNVPKERAIVEVENPSTDLVTDKATKTNEDIPRETMALIETIRQKAISETYKAGEFARDSYLDAVRNAQQEVEKLNFDPEKVEEAIEQLQAEVEKDWDKIASEVRNFSDRLNQAAKAAWEALTAPRSS